MTIDELKALEAAATPGPWKHDALDNMGRNWLIGVINTGTTETCKSTHIVTTDNVRASQCVTGDAEADAIAIAASRNHFRALLKVAEAARCIRHWHDTGRNGEGMIVSSEHVHKLWDALAELEAIR